MHIYVCNNNNQRKKEATKSPILKEDIGRVGGTKERGKWYNSISNENTVFTKRTKIEKNKICLSFAISGLSFIIYFIAVFEQRIMQKTSVHKPVFQGGWHGRTPERPALQLVRWGVFHLQSAEQIQRGKWRQLSIKSVMCHQDAKVKRLPMSTL